MPPIEEYQHVDFKDSRKGGREGQRAREVGTGSDKLHLIHSGQRERKRERKKTSLYYCLSFFVYENYWHRKRKKNRLLARRV